VVWKEETDQSQHQCCHVEYTLSIPAGA
jgi:hypothetical protein